MTSSAKVVSATMLILVPVIVVFATIVNFSSYAYVEISGEGVEIIEVGQPPIPHSWFGDPVPLRYTVAQGPSLLEIGVGREAFVPCLVIRADRPIKGLVAQPCAMAIERELSEHFVFWSYWRNSNTPSCVRPGESFAIHISLEATENPVMITATVKESGFFYYFDFL